MKTASEELIHELLTIESTLEKLSRKLDGHFTQRFEMCGVNPMSILKRVQKLQGELPEVRSDCQQLIQRKQELIDVAKEQLLLNRQRLQDLGARSGCPLPEDQDVMQGFDQAMKEWQQQLATSQATGKYDRQELNKALAHSMIAR